MPKYILGKDFHKNLGKVILMPHPTDPTIAPVELLIESIKNKQVTLSVFRNSGWPIKQTANYSKDKNKYLVIE